ncbi:HNH endonuclease signature motif containing protein [Mycolicibacterium bacteremicum]|uniref:HNH nuclease domain-containing protein n=1 Tax=Mycolicibacterium bacteremicum TaxID=564198 RepID=A0A1W9YWM3_MYCBA|nr:HNH endonuclease signature motif containing protein [Mycolicibacterium bacteremicum]ORA04387.1 hypothetical protein BST17_13940 [Mycolicibacterium bacteremicum]
MPPPTDVFAADTADAVSDRLLGLYAEAAEVIGQRNALDGRLVDIVAEIDGGDGPSLWGDTGCRSLPELVAWRFGMSPRNAQVMVAIAQRIEAFPRLADSLRAGQLSVDQFGVIAEHAADGSDDHYAELAKTATVTQLRTAVKQEPRPDPEPAPEPKRSFSRIEQDGYTSYRIRLPKLEAAKFNAALDGRKDGLIAQWRRDRDAQADRDAATVPQVRIEDQVSVPTDPAPPFPDNVDAFMSVIEAGWDAEAAARPHGAHTTVVVHYDIEKASAALHLGPVLSDADRQFLLCDATCEVWLQRHGVPMGSGRATRTISRRLRRALEHRDPTCVVPGCGATRGLHAHHLVHWEHGGPTELWNLVLLCPFHHRLHHKGEITLTGPAEALTVTDSQGRTLTSASLARPPTGPPPHVAPCRGPSGEKAHWWWYTPFEPKAADN